MQFIINIQFTKCHTAYIGLPLCEGGKTSEFASGQSNSDKKNCPINKGDNDEYQVNFSALIADS